MFQLHHIKGNTYYYKAFTNVGVYYAGNNEVILIDSCDHKRMVRSLDRLLEEKGWRVKAIVNTHSHADHICGNKYFSEKYGCPILSTKLESMFIQHSGLESEFYYTGIDTDKSRNLFFSVDSSDADVLTGENIPDGFEVIPLPGHSFDMIGIKTADDVFFLADAVLSEKTVDEYKLPFFYDINKSIETLEKLCTMSAEYFVPSHCDVTKDIVPLCQKNLKAMKDIKELVFEISYGRSFEEMFCVLMEKMQMRIRTEKYPSHAQMLRNYLQSLVNDDKIYTVLENNKLVYYSK